MPQDRTATDSLWNPTEVEVVPTLVVAHHANPRWVGVRRVLGPGERIELGRGGQVLGGGILDDDRISASHCAIQRRGDSVWVEDLGSHNGTTVDGQIVTRVKVEDGAIIALGRLILIYRQAPLDWLTSPFEGLVSASPAMSPLIETIGRTAALSSSVLVRGETGVGKELVARALHDHSERTGPFLAINCGAMQESVLQSELFGHARGAFTGAERTRSGLIQQATEGTLLLDEIGEASPALQAALLRVLQEREVRAVGVNRPVRVGTRFVASTHQALDEAVEAGRFRADLYHRLARWEIVVPPLRSRRSDIPLIARSVARAVAGRPMRLHHQLAHALMLRPWPGNVRELQTALERLVITQGNVRELRLPHEWDTPSEGAPQAAKPTAVPRPGPDEMRSRLRALDGNMRLYARELGVGRSTLYRWFAAADLDVAEARSGEDGGA